MPTEPIDPNRHTDHPRCLTLVVYAPFGTDKALSQYPDLQSINLVNHPIFAALKAVADKGINVCALVDRVDDDTMLISIPANAGPTLRKQFKTQMDSPRALAHLLEIADDCFPGTDFVLSIEGHGAGYIPDIDVSKLKASDIGISDGKKVQWNVTDSRITPRKNVSPALPIGEPLLPIGEPLLPIGEPLLPRGHYPMSTWGLGEALRLYANGRKSRRSNIAVVHLNNCFNMSVEVLHTIAPHASYAAGYMNYNFFTAGAAVAQAFVSNAINNTSSHAAIAHAISKSNQAMLAAKPAPHPTAGGVVELSRMEGVRKAVDELACALIDALPLNKAEILKAIAAAQQYDTSADNPATFDLETPDALTDIGSLATQLSGATFDHNTKIAAQACVAALAGVFSYGENGSPWVNARVVWKLDNPTLAMNIFLPDPSCIGVWDWRSPYYLETRENAMPSQPHVIDFLRDSPWVEFIIKLHKDTTFVALTPPHIPEFPLAQTRDGHYEKA